jgi:hypothetical protein
MLIHATGTVLSFFGRTLYDEQRDAVFFNWTASGFFLRFAGDRLEMDAEAFVDAFPGEENNLPYLAVFLDGQTEPARVIAMEKGRKTYTLFAADRPEEHVLRVFKRSENSKGRSCLYSLTLQGEPLEYTPPETKWKLEFVGDSITCGFGNEMDAEAKVFSPVWENGLAAYPELAARLLDASYQSVCISGIPLCQESDPKYRLRLPGMPDVVLPARAMEKHYAYADRNHQESMGLRNGFALWDFSRFKPDAVVINLGTNDAFRISVSGGGMGEEQHFKVCYTAFLHALRRHNGPYPVLACTLGPMNYFLYNTIEKAVAAYQAETGDPRVFCMKFGAIDSWGEGFGGLGHPNVKTHLRMAHELADALRPWLTQEA